MLSLDVGQFVEPLIIFEDSIVELLVQTFNSIPIDLDTTDLNFSYCPSGETLLLCFLLLKIWVLLTLLQRQRIMVHQQSQAMDKPAFWMSVWPALRRFLGRIDSNTLSKVKWQHGYMIPSDMQDIGGKWWIFCMEHVFIACTISLCMSQSHCHDQCI